jgi:hypothetical protein
VIHKRLGIFNRRRYPRDLSGGKEATLAIEVIPGQWERIPCYSIYKGKSYLSSEVISQAYAIEKIHPHFFDHDVGAFLGKIAELEKESTVQLIYQVRDPKSSMVSFLRYRERSGSWNRDIGPEQLSQHMERIYDSILRSASECPGLIIDYSQLVFNFETTIARTFDYLWPRERYPGNGSDTELIDLIAKTTSREKREGGGKPFLGKTVGRPFGSHGEYEEYFAAHAKNVDRCYQAYRGLLEVALK